MQSITRHLKVFFYLAKHSIQRDLAYRLDFLSNLLSSLGWVNFTLILILVLSNNVESFGGWNQDQMLLLAGVWMINNGLAFFFFYRNIKQVVKDVVKGDLDFALLKPLDSQFYVSFRRVILNGLLGVIEGVIVIAYVLGRMEIVPSMEQLVRFLVLNGVGLMIYYSLWFFVAALSIHFVMVDNLFHTVPEVIQISKFPQSAYPKTLALLFTSVIPIIIMTTFPARELLGTQSLGQFAYAIMVGVILVITTRKFWYWSLTRYSSASS